MEHIKKDVRNLKGDLVIVPMGDLHSNTDGCDKERLAGLFAWIKRQQKKKEVLILGVGDYIDAWSPSERAVIGGGKSGYGLHETSYEELDRVAFALSDRFLEYFKGVKPGSVVELGEGHHFMTFKSKKSGKYCNLSTTEYMCDKLGAKFGTEVAYVEFLLPHGLKLKVVATHGYGGARTDGARVVKRTRMADTFGDAHIYLMGHDNTKAVYTKQRIGFDGGEMYALKQYFCGTGSFQRAYTIGGETNYVERLLLPPNDLGVVMIHVQVEERKGKWRLDYHISV